MEKDCPVWCLRGGRDRQEFHYFVSALNRHSVDGLVTKVKLGLI